MWDTSTAERTARLLGLGGWLVGLAMGALALVGCGPADEFDGEDVDSEAWGGLPLGHNGVESKVLDYRHAKRANTDAAGVTGAGETRPDKLCIGDDGSTCEIGSNWDAWQPVSYTHLTLPTILRV